MDTRTTMIPACDVRTGMLVSVFPGEPAREVLSSGKNVHNGRMCYLVITAESSGIPTMPTRHEYFLGQDHTVLRYEFVGEKELSEDRRVPRR